jgi:hypothetical protein
MRSSSMKAWADLELAAIDVAAHEAGARPK